MEKHARTYSAFFILRAGGAALLFSCAVLVFCLAINPPAKAAKAGAGQGGSDISPTYAAAGSASQPRQLAVVRQCTEAGLDAALAAGGDNLMDCTSPTTIVVSNPKTISLTGTIIDGNNNLKMDGGNARRVFSVGNGAVTATLRNMTIQNGLGSGSPTAGGGVANGGTLNIENVTFNNNHADNGGAIFNSSGTLNVSNSTFTLNEAIGGEGGAIYNFVGTANVTGCSIQNSEAFKGGGIRNSEGTLNLTNSTVYSNRAQSNGFGGGIYASCASLCGSASTNIRGSTINNNVAGVGGAIRNEQMKLIVTNSTIWTNLAFLTGGAGIDNQQAEAHVVNSTIDSNIICPDCPDNTKGGIFSGGNSASLMLVNTIISNTVNNGGGASRDCVSQFPNVTGNNNMIKDTVAVCGLTNGQNGNIVGANPQLGTLANNGGPTQTCALSNNSPAIDTGDDATAAASVGPPNYGAGGFDQRGIGRPQRLHSDIGAYEALELAQAGPGFVVTKSDDHDDTVCGSSDCTLREAVSAANAANTDATVTFSVSGTITLGSQLPNITSTQHAVTIDGAGHSIILNGNNSVRALRLNSGAKLTVQNLTITNGYASGNGGGAIYNQGGTLTATNVTFSNNRDVNGGSISSVSNGTLTITNCTFSGTSNNVSSGGAIYNSSSTATVSNSTFSGLRADQGGAIYSFGPLTVTNSTFSNNRSNNGGGILIDSGGAVSVTNCTFSGNTGDFGGGGIYNNGESMTLRNTIVASSNGGDCAGSAVTADIHNLADDATCGGATQATTAQINLQALASNGGPTQTMALGAGSVAVDMGADVTTLNGAINNAVTTIMLTNASPVPAGGFTIQIDNEQMTVTARSGNTLTVARGANGTPASSHNSGVAVNPAFDQRGLPFARVANSIVDIGAVELPVAPLLAGVTSRKTHGASGQFDIAMPVMGTPGIECRSGGTTGDHLLVVDFINPVTVNGGNPVQAAVTSGMGDVGSAGVANGGVVGGNGSTSISVPLTNVANAQTIIVTLSNVNDGNSVGSVSVPMSFLLGDTSGNGSVTGTDISQTKLQSGQALSGANFRNDVIVSGTINGTDISSVKLKSGTALP